MRILKYSRNMILAIVTSILLSVCQGQFTVKAETEIPEEVTVTKVGGGVAIGTNGWVLYEEESAFGMFTTDGGSMTSPVLCGDAFIPAPLHDFNLEKKYGASCTLVGSNYEGISEVTDNYIRKIVWYGWLGPKQWSGFSNSAYNYYIGSNKNVLELQGSPYANSTDVSAAAITQNTLSHYRNNKQLHDPIEARGVRAYISFLETASDDIPAYFHVYQLITTNDRQDFFWFSYYPSGDVSLRKGIGSDSNLIKDYPDYFSLGNAEYEVKDGLGNVVGKLVTDANGDSNVLKELKTGTYTVREVKAPKGFKLNNNVETVEIRDGETSVINVSDEPDLLIADVLLRKVADNNEPMKDVQFRVTHYRELKNSIGELEGLSAKRSWVFKTDANGEIKADNSHKVSGDELYLKDNGQAVLLPGTYLFEEVSTPEGFIKADPFLKTVDYDNASGNLTYLVPTVKNIHEGYLELNKKASDELLSITHPITGSQYTVFTNGECSNVARTMNNEEAVLTIGDNGYSQKIALMPGKYYLKETHAPRGWALDENVYELFISSWKTTTQQLINKPQTITIVIQKVDKETGERIPQGLGEFAGAVYKVEHYDVINDVMVKDGEIVLDENGQGKLEKLVPGQYTVTEIKAPAGYSLNSEPVEVRAGIKEDNTAVFVYEVESLETVTKVQIIKKTIDESELEVPLEGAVLQIEDENGNVVVNSWVSTTEPVVIKGLKQDQKYYLVETSAPEGYLALTGKIEFTVGNEEGMIEVFNEPLPEIATSAVFENGLKMSEPRETEVIDEVDLSRLKKGGSYLIRGELVDEEENVISSGNLEFVAEGRNEIREISFSVNGKELAGNKLIVYEYLYRENNGDWEEVARHKDPYDEKQTVYFTSLATSAFDGADEDKYLLNQGEQVIKDVISYENLLPGEYEVETVLVDSNTSEVVLSEQERHKVEVNTLSGSFETTLKVDGKALEGRTLTVYEYVYQNDKLVASHCEKDCVSQMISIPSIITNASRTFTSEQEDFSYVTVDEIVYDNLLADGSEYEMTGTLIDKKTGNIMKDEAGNDLTSSVSFTPEESSGSIQVSFEGDGNLVKGNEVVVYEQLKKDGKVFALHNDLNNEKQTVEFPDLNIKVLKTDENGKPLADALLQVLDEEGNIVCQFLSGEDEDGFDISTYVKGGKKYVLHELESPFGYKKAEDEEFIAEGVGEKVQLIEMNDELENIRIKVIKLNEEKKRLANCEFTVYLDDKAIERKMTDLNGEVMFELPYRAGYYLKETKAPEGYYRNDEKYVVIINEGYDFEKNIVEFNVTDKKIPVVDTGDNSNLYIWYASAASSLSGAVYILLRRRKQNR